MDDICNKFPTMAVMKYNIKSIYLTLIETFFIILPQIANPELLKALAEYRRTK